jgi:hypothetical protein
MKVPTLLQAVLAVLRNGGVDLESALFQFGINTREGMVSWNVITWTRSYDTEPYVKKDKKGRLLVAQKYCRNIRWELQRSKIKATPGIIQVNVLKSQSKRGGWLIRVHKQTPVFSERTMKFVFCNYWEGYWASEQMLANHLVSKAKNGKLSSAVLMSHAFGPRIEMDIVNNISFLKEEISR